MREMCGIIARIAARGRTEFEEDFVLPLALERALEVLGEAATNVSEEGRAPFASVPWSEITRLRVRLAHHYHRILPDLLWGIAVDEIPAVAEALGPLRDD